LDLVTKVVVLLILKKVDPLMMVTQKGGMVENAERVKHGPGLHLDGDMPFMEEPLVRTKVVLVAAVDIGVVVEPTEEKVAAVEVVL
jgi:hypothetical protein